MGAGKGVEGRKRPERGREKKVDTLDSKGKRFESETDLSTWCFAFVSADLQGTM